MPKQEYAVPLQSYDTDVFPKVTFSAALLHILVSVVWWLTLKKMGWEGTSVMCLILSLITFVFMAFSSLLRLARYKDPAKTRDTEELEGLRRYGAGVVRKEIKPWLFIYGVIAVRVVVFWRLQVI